MAVKDSPQLKRCFRLPLRTLVVLLCVVLSALAGCRSAEEPLDEGEQLLTLSSPAFVDGGWIPVKYACTDYGGQDISPELNWADMPAATRSLALIFDDPDSTVGLLNHWIVFNIPPSVSQLPEDAAGREQLPSGALQGKNGLDVVGYVGPCPPNEPVHHYVFTLYALDSLLDLDTGASKGEVMKAMQGHVLGHGHLTGLFQQ
jgi:Raf kinase inhibitor-like YbhB/YbcL family protein